MVQVHKEWCHWARWLIQEVSKGITRETQREGKTQREKEIIDTVINILKNKKVTEISEMSHKEKAWKKTKRYEKISFEYAMDLNIVK